MRTADFLVNKIVLEKVGVIIVVGVKVMTMKMNEEDLQFFRRVPEVKIKSEKSRHLCTLCNKQMGAGVLVMQYLNGVNYGRENWRLIHVDCWLRKKARLLVMSEKFDDIEFDDIETLRNEVFVEEL